MQLIRPWQELRWVIPGTETIVDETYPHARERKLIQGYGYMWYCPGCDGAHGVPIKGPSSTGRGPWTFNGDLEHPTFGPSVLIHRSTPHPACHCYVENGMIRFLSDCDHALAGQTVPIPEWPN